MKRSSPRQTLRNLFVLQELFKEDLWWQCSAQNGGHQYEGTCRKRSPFKYHWRKRNGGLSSPKKWILAGLSAVLVKPCQESLSNEHSQLWTGEEWLSSRWETLFCNSVLFSSLVQRAQLSGFSKWFGERNYGTSRAIDQNNRHLSLPCAHAQSNAGN